MQQAVVPRARSHPGADEHVLQQAKAARPYQRTMTAIGRAHAARQSSSSRTTGARRCSTWRRALMWRQVGCLEDMTSAWAGS